MSADDNNRLVFDMSTGSFSGANMSDITNHQTQVLYEMNRDRILERLHCSVVLLKRLISLIEIANSNESDSNSIELNLDSLVDNDEMRLLQLDFRNSSRSKIITRTSISQDELTLDDENLKTIEDLKISDGTLSTTFVSKLSTLVQHFSNLTKRVTDPNSKILICGDLNSGKSSFVNKLLNLKDLDGQCITSPIDQLPLTSIFIEFKHVSFNYLNKKPEVHAIIKKTEVGDDNTFLTIVENYDCMDPETYDVFDLNKLQKLVSDETTKDKYSLLVVYVNESYSEDKKEQSLLKNGIVDCSVIDSPGLNVDDFVTKDIFSKQETIDLIIFIINAENQLTLSGKDFINTAKAEKNFIFFVVNKFDQIRDKDRCSQLIMNQIQELTPLTYKQHDDFVHCISSAPDSGDDDSPGENDSPGNNNPDINFDKLRDSIKNFVVLKKSKNKLLPSQTFLNNLLRDLYFLTDTNIKIYSNRIGFITDKIKQIKPEIDLISNSNVDVNKKIDYLIDNVVDSGYDFVKETISTSLDDVVLPEYKGLTNVYDYILENLECMNDKIEQSVLQSELYGKHITTNTVDKIYQLNNVNENDRPFFDHDLMFSSKANSSSIEPSLFNDINVWFELSDLFEPSWEGFINFLVHGGSIVNKTSNIEGNNLQDASFFNRIASQFGSVYKNPALIFNSRIPTLALYSLGGSKIINTLVAYGSSVLTWNSLVNIATTLAATSGCLIGAYLINDLPRALPYNLISKYKETLKSIDYPHTQAVRITKDIRRILKIPQLEFITKNNLILFNVKEKEKNWQSILQKLSSNAEFLNEYQKDVIEEQQKLMEIVVELD